MFTVLTAPDESAGFSRITLSQIALRKETVDIASVVQRVLEQSAPQMRAREQTVEVELPFTPISLEADLCACSRLSATFSTMPRNTHRPAAGSLQLDAATWLRRNQSSASEYGRWLGHA